MSRAEPQEQYVVYLSVCQSHTDPTGCCHTQATSPSRACQPHPPLGEDCDVGSCQPHPQSPLSIAQGTSCSPWAPLGRAQSQLAELLPRPPHRKGQQAVSHGHRPFPPNLLHDLTTRPSNRHQLRATPMASLGMGFRTQLVGKMSSHSAVFVGRTELVAEG